MDEQQELKEQIEQGEMGGGARGAASFLSTGGGGGASQHQWQQHEVPQVAALEESEARGRVSTRFTAQASWYA